ncbi:hypothetical protein EMIT079MI2_480006 [Bacillus sp. IT-79MI2]
MSKIKEISHFLIKVCIEITPHRHQANDNKYPLTTILLS